MVYDVAEEIVKVSSIEEANKLLSKRTAKGWYTMEVYELMFCGTETDETGKMKPFYILGRTHKKIDYSDNTLESFAKKRK